MPGAIGQRRRSPAEFPWCVLIDFLARRPFSWCRRRSSGQRAGRCAGL